MEHLWAGWRSDYLRAVGADDRSLRPDARGSLFERLLAEDDDVAHVIHRAERAATLCNAYPYAAGHLLVVPLRAVPALGDLDADEHAALWAEVRDAVAAVQAAYGCPGVNVGANLGAAAGAGVPDHLHVHVVPRWDGDTNFMTAVADVRVVPESLGTTWERVRAAWPVPAGPPA